VVPPCLILLIRSPSSWPHWGQVRWFYYCSWWLKFANLCSFFQLYCILIKTQKSLKALFLNFQTFLQGTHIEPVVTHFEPLSLSLWSLNHSSMMSRYGVTIEVLRFATGGWGEKSSWLRYLRTVLRSKPVRDEIFEIEYPFWLKSLISLIWDIVSISFPPLPLVVLRQRISDRLFCFNMSLSDFEEFPFWYWGILSPISGTFIIRYTNALTGLCLIATCGQPADSDLVSLCQCPHGLMPHCYLCEN